MTRYEWLEMWEAIKSIESQAKLNRIAYKRDINLIKDKIQSVIGQME